MLERKNEANLRISFLLLIVIPVYNCIMYLFKVAGLGIPLKMIHIYILLLIYLIVILFKYKLPLKNLLCYFAILAFYGISFIWATSEAKQYFYSTDVYALLLIAAPIACICTAQVNNWNPLFTKRQYLVIVDIVIVLSLLSKIGMANDMDYMSFSYGLLPLWGICLISAFVFGNKIQWFFLVIGGIEGLIYGARAPLIWIIVLAFVSWLVLSKEDKKNIGYLILFRHYYCFWVFLLSYNM